MSWTDHLATETDPQTKVDVVIAHLETPWFLKWAVAQVLRHRGPFDIRVLVADNGSTPEALAEVRAFIDGVPKADLIEVPRDAVRNVGPVFNAAFPQTRPNAHFVAILDCDAWPISDYWLWFPVMMLLRHGCHAAGVDYGNSQPFSDPESEYCVTDGGGAFPWVHHVYAVMLRETALEAAEQVGFDRKPTTGWGPFPKGCDTGTAVAHWLHRQGRPVWGIPLSGKCGEVPQQGAWGHNVGGLVFHMSLGSKARSPIRATETNDDLLTPEYLRVFDWMRGRGIGEEFARRLVEVSDGRRTLENLLAWMDWREADEAL